MCLYNAHKFIIKQNIITENKKKILNAATCFRLNVYKLNTNMIWKTAAISYFINWLCARHVIYRIFSKKKNVIVNIEKLIIIREVIKSFYFLLYFYMRGYAVSSIIQWMIFSFFSLMCGAAAWMVQIYI